MKTQRTSLWVTAVLMALLPTIIMARMQDNISATMVSISQTEACYDNTQSMIHITLEGQAPFRVVYTDGVDEYNVESFNSDLDVHVQPVITTTYSLVSVEDNTGESGTVSGSFTLTVYQAPMIVGDLSPVPTYACPAEAVSLHIDAEGWNIVYQWYKDDAPITDNNTAFTATLILPSFMTEDSGMYRCGIVGSCYEGETFSVSHAVMPSVPPQITEDVQPGLRELCTGSPVLAHVTVTGTDVQYQWRRNGLAIEGASNATFSISAVSSTDVGVYDCMVNARCYPSPMLTSSFTILVDVPVGFISQPESVVSCQGQDAQFLVAVYGSEPTFQWLKNGEPIHDNLTAQTHHLMLTGLSAEDAGSYRILIGSRCSEISLQSDEALLSVLPLPAFVELPKSASICEHGNVALQARATGVDVRYQWLLDNHEVEGATDSNLYLYDVMPSMSGKYSVRVTDVCMSLESESVDVTVVSPVRILEQPHAVTVCEQHPVLLSVTATGSTGLYQWFKDGVPLGEWNTPELRIENADNSVAGLYTCKLIGAVECQPREVMTEPARVIVLSAPVIATQTRVAYAAVHGQAVMRVGLTALSEADLIRTYQWYVDGAALVDDQRFIGTSTMTLTVLDIGVHDAQRVYTCRVNGMCGAAWSDPIRIVIPPLTIMQEPKDAKVCAGSSAQVSIVAVTDEGIPLTYQWLRNGVALQGATSATLSMPMFNDADNGDYSVRMNLGDNVFVESRSAHLFALHAPRFADPDEYRTVYLCPGTYFALNARVVAGNDLSYQWYLNAVPIEGAVDNTFVEYAVANASAGQYAVRVYNDCAAIEHTVVNLVVRPETEITRHPAPHVIVREGSRLLLSAEARGDRLQYQWEHDGVLINGATSDVYTKIAAAEDAGYYKVRVMSECGSLVSDASRVLVNSISSAGEDENAGWSVGPCTPQPVLDRCVIAVNLAGTSHVRMMVVDMFGREVCVLRDENMNAGSYSVVLDANERGLTSGRYTVVLSSSLGHRLTTSVMIVR